jgi:hypothetical protein
MRHRYVVTHGSQTASLATLHGGALMLLTCHQHILAPSSVAWCFLQFVVKRQNPTTL